jgi:3-oxoacyl-[acyl-carrier protein] reductase
MQLGPGTRVLVTGASRGIGRALAEALAARGCTVGLCARSEDELSELAAALPGDAHEVLPADIGERASIEQAVERFGDCDVLVANAGIARYQLVRDMDVETFERLTRVNWLGTVYTVKAALPRMLGRARGHVVVVSSGAGHRAFPQAAAYGATKHAQKAFADVLWHELAGTGVSVTTVFPGEIKTHLHDHELETMPDWYHGDRAIPPEKLAPAVLKGIEDDARYVFYPPIIRLLRVIPGISPALGDAVLRRLRGDGVAPRRR